MDANNLIEGPNPAVRQANCAAEGLPANFSSQAEMLRLEVHQVVI